MFIECHPAAVATVLHVPYLALAVLKVLYLASTALYVPNSYSLVDRAEVGARRDIVHVHLVVLVEFDLRKTPYEG